MKEQFQYYKDGIESEQSKLTEFFAYYLPANFQPKKIMNFCCGLANEEPVLYELFGQDISITSFDRSDDYIKLAKELDLIRNSIIKLDLTEIDKHFSDEKFDLLVGRNIPINPNYRSYGNEIYPDHWSEYLKNLKKHLSGNGLLLMTFAREDEFFRAQELLTDLDFHLIKQETNQIVIPSDHIGIAGADIKDNYVILAENISMS